MYMSEGEGGGGENGGRLIGDSMQVLTALAEQIQVLPQDNVTHSNVGIVYEDTIIVSKLCENF